MKKSMLLIYMLIILLYTNLFSQKIESVFPKIREINNSLLSIENNPYPIINKVDSVITSGGYFVKQRFTYKYDNEGNITSEYIEVWRDSSFSKYLTGKYYYNLSGKLENILTEWWNGTNWVNSANYIFSYDDKGNLISEIDKSWETNEWVNFLSVNNYYDDSNNIIQQKYEQWNNGEWENTSQYFFTYNSINKKESNLGQTWDGVNWKNSIKLTYKYDQMENISELLYEDWVNDGWRNNLKYLYNYNINNLIDTLLFEEWVDSSWISKRIETNNYNQDSKISETLIRQYVDNAWNNFQHDTYLYDKKNIIECKSDLWLNGEWGQNNNAYEFYDRNGYSFHYYGYDIKIYYNNLVGVNQEKVPEIGFKLEQNYPNPFNPSTRINYQIPKAGNVIIKVFDCLGNEVQTLINNFQNQGFYSIDFDASKLSSGIYFYQFKVNNFIATKKMILLR